MILSNVAQWVVYAAIAVIFAVCFVKCVLPVVRVRRTLRKAIHSLKSGDSKAWKEDGFLGKGPLSTHWRDYLSNLFFAEGEYHNPSNVEDYINEESAISGPGRAHLAEAVPGLMVSLGILGTFMGITMGLTDLDLSSADAMVKAINTLVPGMKYAFMTSILGVIGSLAFTITTRAVNGSTLNALNAFYQAMQVHAGVVTVDPMTQIAIYQQEQTGLIQTMTEELTDKMADKLGAVLEMSLQPIQDSLDNFIAATSREQVRGVERICDRFIDHMDASLHGQFDRLAATIEETCRWQEQTRASVLATLDGIQRVAKDVAEVQKLSEGTLVKFDGYVNKLSAAQLQVDNGYARVSATVSHMEAVAKQESEYLSLVSKFQAELQKSIGNFQSASDNFMRSFVENNTVATNALRAVSAELGKNGETLSGAHAGFVDGVVKELKQTFEMYDKNMDEVTKELGWVVGGIKDAVDGLPRVIDSTAGHFADQMDQLIITLQRAQMALDDAVLRLYPGETGRTRRMD